MPNRTSFEARGPWTKSWEYARAVRVGDRIEVAGTSAIRADGEIAAVGDPYGQTVFIFEVIQRALEGLGGSLADVVRTRAFLKNIEDWREVGRRHAELFGERPPASSCIGGIELLRPELLVEVEATAVLGS